MGEAKKAQRPAVRHEQGESQARWVLRADTYGEGLSLEQIHPDTGRVDTEIPAALPQREAASARIGPGSLLQVSNPEPASELASCSLAQCPRQMVAQEPPKRRLQTVLLATAACLVYVFAFHLSVVRGSSMVPGIHDGDRILIEPCAGPFGQPPERGDVVVLKNPFDPSVDYIKRIIGLPGDEVVLEDGHVWINGVLLDEPYVQEPDRFARVSTRVKPAHFFVLGDNRTRSCDSREFGQVAKDYVQGRVHVRVWPPERIGTLDP